MLSYLLYTNFFIRDKIPHMKIVELHKVPKNKRGKINKNGIKPEPCEKFTLNYLILFGFNIELIKPVGVKGTNNPDVLIFGTIWEIKTPTSHNKNTIKMRFRHASNQAQKVIFDLRGIEKHADEVEKQIIELFKGDGNVRRMMLIAKSGKIFDISK